MTSDSLLHPIARLLRAIRAYAHPGTAVRLVRVVLPVLVLWLASAGAVPSADAVEADAGTVLW